MADHGRITPEIKERIKRPKDKREARRKLKVLSQRLESVRERYGQRAFKTVLERALDTKAAPHGYRPQVLAGYTLSALERLGKRADIHEVATAFGLDKDDFMAYLLLKEEGIKERIARARLLKGRQLVDSLGLGEVYGEEFCERLLQQFAMTDYPHQETRVAMAAVALRLLREQDRQENYKSVGAVFGIDRRLVYRAFRSIYGSSASVLFPVTVEELIKNSAYPRKIRSEALRAYSRHRDEVKGRHLPRVVAAAFIHDAQKPYLGRAQEEVAKEFGTTAVTLKEVLIEIGSRYLQSETVYFRKGTQQPWSERGPSL